MPGVTDVTTDKSALTASFTYDDQKAKIEEILEQLDKKSDGRYKASVVGKPAK